MSNASSLSNAKFRKALSDNKKSVSSGNVRIVIEVPPSYRTAVKTIAAAEDTTVKETLMEAIEMICEDRNILIRS